MFRPRYASHVVRPQLVALASLVAGCSLVSGAASLSIEDGPPIADSLDSSASEAGTEPDADVDPGPFAVAIDPDRITSAENAKTSVEVTVHRSRAATGSSCHRRSSQELTSSR